MKMKHLIVAIFVASLIFFGATAYGFHTSAKEHFDVYLEPKLPSKIYIISYGENVEVNITITGKFNQNSSMKNISVSMDGKKNLSG